MLGCSHSRSYEYFAESIVNSQFISQQCNSVTEALKQKCKGNKVVSMGGDKENSTLRGIYHLKTAKKSPYALGNYYFVKPE